MRVRFSKFAYALGFVGIIVGIVCILDSNADIRVCLSSVFCGTCMIILARAFGK